jgi:hypothetical protein
MLLAWGWACARRHVIQASFLNSKLLGHFIFNCLHARLHALADLLDVLSSAFQRIAAGDHREHSNQTDKK